MNHHRKPPQCFDEALLDAEAAHADDVESNRLLAALRGEDDFTPATYRQAREQLALEAIR